jgi:UDP-2-acetamido-2-deoxy-ribo-hexuluronate aminotransferase
MNNLSKNKPINMYDPTRDYMNHKNEYMDSINEVLDQGNFINGKQVIELEHQLSEYTGSKHCITVGNGTDALQIALMCLGIGPGDEVITVPHTWISTSEVISLLKAKPVFVDIESDTFNIDILKIEEKITDKTKVIIPVSLYGQMPDYDKINEIAEKYGLVVIEDGAQSFGATQRDKKSCNVTRIGSTSFFPSKPLGCYGDGGALFTNDDTLAKKMRAIKNHGGTKRFYHDYIGVNSRLDTVQAAILNVKMKYLDSSIKNRNIVAQRYTDGLCELLGIVIPSVQSYNTSVWAQYSLLIPTIDSRDRLVEKLKESGINVSIFYPKPLHYQPCFTYLGYKEGDFPVSESVCSTIINLPCYGELTEDEQMYIIDTFKKIYLDL